MSRRRRVVRLLDRSMIPATCALAGMTVISLIDVLLGHAAVIVVMAISGVSMMLGLVLRAILAALGSRPRMHYGPHTDRQRSDAGLIGAVIAMLVGYAIGAGAYFDTRAQIAGLEQEVVRLQSVPAPADSFRAHTAMRGNP